MDFYVRLCYKGIERLFPKEIYSMQDRGYIIASDYMACDGFADVSDAIQNLIDLYPNRTIFFFGRGLSAEKADSYEL